MCGRLLWKHLACGNSRTLNFPLIQELTLQVLPEYVKNNVLSVSQAVKVVQDLFFKTSNSLYGLNLPLEPLKLTSIVSPASSVDSDVESNLDILTSFLEEFPVTKFLRIQYLDYTATPRLRVIPVKRALSVLQTQGNLTIGITKASR
jgi:hypothetical protein